MMNAQSLVPPPPMPAFIEAPWARPAFTPPAIPPQWSNHAVAKMLWTRLFADDQDASRPAWPSKSQWESFGTIVEKIDAIATVDRLIQMEPDPAKRDELTDQVFNLDADLIRFARDYGYPRTFLRNVANNRTRTNPKPTRRSGEDAGSYDARLAAWRREKSLADA